MFFIAWITNFFSWLQQEEMIAAFLHKGYSPYVREQSQGLSRKNVKKTWFLNCPVIDRQLSWRIGPQLAFSWAFVQWGRGGLASLLCPSILGWPLLAQQPGIAASVMTVVPQTWSAIPTAGDHRLKLEIWHRALRGDKKMKWERRFFGHSEWGE